MEQDLFSRPFWLPRTIMGAPLDAQEHESVCVCVCMCVCVFACVWPLPELQAVAQNHYEAVCVCVCVCVIKHQMGGT